MDPNQQPDTPPEIIHPNDNANQVINTTNTSPTLPPIPQTANAQQPEQIPTPTTPTTEPQDTITAQQTAQPSIPSTLNYSNKYAKRSGITSIILGFMLILFGIWIAIYINSIGALNIIFGIIYIIFGIKLLGSHVSVEKIIAYSKIISMTVLINLGLGLFLGGGVGLLPFLLVYFLAGSMKDMYNQGLVSSKLIFKAKPINNQPIFATDIIKPKKPILTTFVVIVTILISIFLINGALWANGASKYLTITDEIIANDKSAIESVKSYHSPSKAEYIVDLQRGIDLYKNNIALTEKIANSNFMTDEAKELNNNKKEYSTLRVKQYELIKEGLESNTEYLKNPELLSTVESIEQLLPEEESGGELKQITFKDRIINFNENEFAALKVVRDYPTLNYEQKISGIQNGLILWDENLAILNQIQADGYALDINKDYLADLQKYTELRKEEFTIILAGELSNDQSYRNSERLKFLTSQIDSM